MKIGDGYPFGLFRLRERLRAARGAAFSSLADELVRAAQAPPDPLAARAAVMMLGEEVEFQDPAASWSAHLAEPIVRGDGTVRIGSVSLPVRPATAGPPRAPSGS
ncbi:MAG: hypothetical protein HY319_29825 [Armatimonadetes bacterium]|nr:hypothetical protein [Armatimonadota bacterium]